MITITDWVRAKVCDISRPSTHSVAVETHLRVTLSSSPPLSCALALLSSRLSSPLIPRAFSVQLCFTCRVCLDGCCSVTSTPPPPSSNSLPQILCYPFALESFFFLDSSSRSRLLPSLPLVSSPLLSSAAASDCTGLFGMQEAPEAWRV